MVAKASRPIVTARNRSLIRSANWDALRVHTEVTDTGAIVDTSGPLTAPGPSIRAKRDCRRVDFTGGLVPADDTNQLSFRMADRFPLWVEFDM